MEPPFTRGHVAHGARVSQRYAYYGAVCASSRSQSALPHARGGVGTVEDSRADGSAEVVIRRYALILSVLLVHTDVCDSLC